ncbi:MAG: hypothetical protein BRC35_16430 [Cyanobacteria bacterium QH_10_48_56]|nr:MAG: hypothetical protein BRC35_16430 [Cyanobacteria bacterium QH_10_48_56]
MKETTLKAQLRPIVRPLKSAVKTTLGINQNRPGNYWEKRKNLRYYQEALRLAKKYAPDAETAIDVGSHNSQLLAQVDWIPSITAIDIKRVPEIPKATNIQGDFMQFVPDSRFDLVFCLQLLEHLEYPAPFAQKLLDTGKTIVISVPYKWHEESCEYHIQDPVDENKLLSWTQKSWLEKFVVQDYGAARMVAVFEGTGN